MFVRFWPVGLVPYWCPLFFRIVFIGHQSGLETTRPNIPVGRFCSLVRGSWLALFRQPLLFLLLADAVRGDMPNIRIGCKFSSGSKFFQFFPKQFCQWLNGLRAAIRQNRHKPRGFFKAMTAGLCSAGFQTCCIADFQVGGTPAIVQSAGLETRDTADLEVCATASPTPHRPVESTA